MHLITILVKEFSVSLESELMPLALKRGGTIVGWGYNYLGEAAPPEGNDFVAISVRWWLYWFIGLAGIISLSTGTGTAI
jgi:hypothetical protein